MFLMLIHKFPKKKKKKKKNKGKAYDCDLQSIGLKNFCL